MRDDFSGRTKEALAKRVGMCCSNPRCRKPTSGPRSDPQRTVNIGVAAHITAASPDGPRYQPALSSSDRCSIQNGIWLCQNCAKLIDNDEGRYSIEVLQIWKKTSENNALLAVERSSLLVESTTESTEMSAVVETGIVAPEMVKTCRPLDGRKARVVFESSPFHPAGAVPLGCESYVTRSCDGELQRIANNRNFVWIQGEFQSGKTSLIRRHQAWLPSDWIVVCPDLELCDRTTNERFWRDFFAEIEEGPLKQTRQQSEKARFGWRSIKLLLDDHRIAFLLDEIGVCKAQQVRHIIQTIHALADKAPTQVKLVVCYKDGPAGLLASCGLSNPKYASTWELVRLTPFSQAEVETLIGLFPRAIASVLRGKVATIESMTGFRPNGVQRLLHTVWEKAQISSSSGEKAELLLDGWLAEASVK